MALKKLIPSFTQCFFSSILWHCSSEHNSQVYLAKFGDIKNMKVKKSEAPIHIVGNCDDFWQYLIFLCGCFFIFLTREFAKEYSFLQNIFLQNDKKSPQKN